MLKAGEDGFIVAEYPVIPGSSARDAHGAKRCAKSAKRLSYAWKPAKEKVGSLIPKWVGRAVASLARR